MQKNILLAILVILIISISGPAYAQKKEKRGDKQQSTTLSTSAQDSTKSAAKGPATIAKFIKPSAKIMKGMTTVYMQDDKYYLNIPDSLMGRDIRMVSRISKAAEGKHTAFDGYAGDIINDAMFRFERGPENKIFLKSLMFIERSSGEMSENVANSNFPAIVASFPIKAISADKKDNIIDVTDFISSDPEYLFFDKGTKKQLKIGSIQKDKSYIKEIKTYPINTEFKVINTYSLQEGNPTATYELNSSFVLLPKVPMLARYADNRVGYFTVSYTDFDKNPQKVERTRLITRWRLEPKPEDIEKYKRGELVEPAKQIVYYIDPATPKEWVPYLIQGVNDWQKVFEKAGFKNAIVGKLAPTKEQDSTWSLEDARYSAIVYKPSSTPNASGPHINDPRSGEIIESHVNWYHNEMSLLKNWYFIQCSPVDPGARKMTFDTELMGQLIRFVSSHELGHTMGLRHNFGGSSHFTAAQLRDPQFLKQNGNSTTLMDYSRFNYVAQPGDNIPRELLFPRLGEYDDWSIEWGYRRFLDINDPEKELPKLNKWIIEKNQNPNLVFGTESDPNDPRYQSEDLGANHMETNTLGIKNLKYIMNHLIEWTSEPDKGYDNLKTMSTEVVSQYQRYINHVAKWIGGIYHDNKTIEQPGAIYYFVEKSKQQEAMTFLKKNLFTPQLWLVPAAVMEKIGTNANEIIESTYNNTLNKLLSRRVLTNLYKAQIQEGAKAYTIDNLFADMNSAVWSANANPTDATYKRILQKCYVDALLNLYTGDDMPAMYRKFYNIPDPDKDKSDVGSIIYYQLNTLVAKLKAIPATTPIEKAHYLFLSNKIHKALTDPTIKSQK